MLALFRLIGDQRARVQRALQLIPTRDPGLIPLPVRGLSHITGGGIVDNILRVMPASCSIIVKKQSWDVPPVFSFLQKAGKISEPEMMRTFNNGIGMILVVPENNVQEVLERLSAINEKAFIIGEVVERKDSRERIEWV